MATQLVFDSAQQFEELVAAQDYELATSFVESMLNNINADEEVVTVIEAFFEEEDTIYDFEIEKVNFIPNFKEFLTIYEREEDYEGCLIISNAIKTLEGQA
mgnify:CR=1 FL=1|jgi:MinD-like ATPase involved in chromosome partitioning or flagellar assembly